jgi:DNA-binding MarR family transcriptional regulator
MENKYNVTESLLRLVRVMRRKPTEHGRHSHGVGKLIRVIAANSGASSRELAEIMDIRPSSLTELLNRLEERGIIIRTRDEKDLRVMRVSISEFGLLEMKRHEEEKRQSFDDLAECLNQEEQKTFCELCDRLASHAEKVNHEYQAQGAPHDHHHAADEHHGYHHLHHGPGNHRFREER